jgi:hypothetical protein
VPSPPPHARVDATLRPAGLEAELSQPQFGSLSSSCSWSSRIVF